MDVISHLEFYQLISVIRELKSEPDLVKDYVFPIITLVISAVLGWAIASHSFRRQEDLQIEKEKLLIANNWSLKAYCALHDLITLKEFYTKAIDKFTSPAIRAMKVNPLRTSAKLIDGNYSELSFILSKSKKPEEDDWASIHKIRALFENYNLAIETWRRRDAVMEDLMEKLSKALPDCTSYMLSEEDICQFITQKDLSSMIMLNERLFRLIDGLLIELLNFTVQFPELVKPLVNLKRLRRYGKLVINVDTKLDARAKLVFSRISKPNFIWLAEYMGISVEEITLWLATPYDSVELCSKFELS